MSPTQPLAVPACISQGKPQARQRIPPRLANIRAANDSAPVSAPHQPPPPPITSLDEGFNETLTLHRLGLFKELARSFKTTNGIENLNSLIANRTGKVDR